MRFLCTNGGWNVPAGPIQANPGDQCPMVVLEEAYKEYAAQFGTSQSLARLNERGGFGASELAILLYQRIKRIDGADAMKRPLPKLPDPPNNVTIRDNEDFTRDTKTGQRK